MTVHTPELLTPEELACLIEVAVASPDPRIPASHLPRLVTPGYVAVTVKLVVTGDGLIRITESDRPAGSLWTGDIILTFPTTVQPLAWLGDVEERRLSVLPSPPTPRKTQ